MPKPPHLRLFSAALSGHSHRARLMLALLDLQADIVEIDMRQGAHKAPEFLKINAFGQVPVLQDGDVLVADSNAILVYLTTKYDTTRDWLPPDPLAAAHVQRWLSIAAGQLAQGPAAARVATVFGVPLDKAKAQQIAEGLFAVMEQELTGRSFLAAEGPTIADIALYTYTAHAPEGDISLEPFQAIRGWLRRIEALPRFVPMKRVSVAA